MDEAITAMATVYSEHRSELVVRERRDVADGVISLVLGHPDEAELPMWTAGAHIDLVLDEGVTRQYSLCGAPADRGTWRIGVLLNADGRGGSKRVHETLTEGTKVTVRGPRNHFPLVGASRYLFLAGGIGITPLLPMIASASAAGADWELHYGGRSRRSMGFIDELTAYGEHVHLWPEDERGMLDLQALLGTPQPDTLIYACGPEGMLSAVESSSSGWPAGSLHIERFAAKVVEAAPDAAATFEVVLQRSGMTVVVPEDKTILDAVSDAGVSVLSSCLEGVCGTCETRVLEGKPDHRDSLLSEEEQEEGEYMMICVSRSRSERLVLDL